MTVMTHLLSFPMLSRIKHVFVPTDIPELCTVKNSCRLVVVYSEWYEKFNNAKEGYMVRWLTVAEDWTCEFTPLSTMTWLLMWTATYDRSVEFHLYQTPTP